MRRLTAVFLFTALLVLSACTTPPQVKELSTAQIAYFNTAIDAVRAQSDALLIAAERIKRDAETRIKARTVSSRLDVRDALSPPRGQGRLDPTVVNDLLKGLESAKENEQQNIAKLQATIDEIKVKIGELNSYIAKMKDVQIALDAFLQSKDAGESVVQNLLKHPNVGYLLESVSDTVPRLSGTTETLKRLLGDLPSA
ncbi:MAG: hypothetical protein JJ959_18040 [Nisaea sp.]|uniref:hypothetical protein n=1 Tax=Nisaea sp. TaxID=2024842 RepID=UPI001B2EFBE8|nr:hypothetical protein [Nisaea sp.]MBO6562452.1 hypothetical protein [Nisaea sp.]